MEDYKPNSHRYKEEQKRKAQEKEKVEKVIKGTARTKKKTEVSKFASVFVSEDVANVKDYILMDVLIPAAKKTISEIISNGTDMILYGATGQTRKRSGASTVSYRNFYDDRRDAERRPTRTRTSYDYDDVVLDTRGEAEDVLERMTELIDTYGCVSVADMYDLVGVTCNYTDNKYGWTNLRNAEPIRVRDGYLLKLPKVTLID